MDFEKAKAYCRGMPGATEDVKWGADTVFSVGAKMFMITGAGASADRMSFKVDEERFLELTDRPGFMPAPYLARAKWVCVTRADAVSDAEAQALLRRSHELVFATLTKKLQREIGDAA